MSDQFLEQQIKSSVFLSGLNSSKRLVRMEDDEDNAHHFCVKGILHFEFILQSQTVNQAYYVEVLKWYHEVVCRRGLNFGPIGFSTMTMLQLTRHSLSSSFWPKKLITEI
jgi:hypothetical protein